MMQACQVIVVEGEFSWFAAWMMMFWLVVCICALSAISCNVYLDHILRHDAAKQLHDNPAGFELSGSVTMGVLTFQAQRAMPRCLLRIAYSCVQGDGIERISEEISFVRQQKPPYGPSEQPQMATMREINEPFSSLAACTPMAQTMWCMIRM